jgi:hypothetical protein
MGGYSLFSFCVVIANASVVCVPRPPLLGKLVFANPLTFVPVAVLIVCPAT